MGIRLIPPTSLQAEAWGDGNFTPRQMPYTHRENRQTYLLKATINNTWASCQTSFAKAYARHATSPLCV